MRDEEWLRQSFMVPSMRFSNQDAVRRELTEAEYKFTDTTLGGNFCINPPPQFTRNADLRVPSRFSGSKGMGRFYSEALDDRGIHIHLRFGVPQFNSLTNFFFNFYHPGAASLANRGRAPSAFYYAGRAIGFVVSLPAQPIIWASQVVRFLIEKPASRYYYLKPAMPLYWSAVSTMVNMIGVNMGVIGRGSSQAEQQLRQHDPYEDSVHRIHYESMANAHPNIFRPDGGVDIYAMATRAQRMAHINRVNMHKTIERAGSWEELNRQMQEAATELLVDANPPNLDDYLKSYHSGSATTMTSRGDSDTPDGEFTGDQFETVASDDSFVEHLIAELEDGSQFVTFRVDDIGTVTESFSNSVAESQLASTINSASSSARMARFSFADGNIGNGIVSGLVTGAIKAATDTVTGFLEGVQLSGLAALFGSAFADIPKVWESSSVNFPSASYTIELRSPYGTPFARFQNLMVPLAMLLAGVLPLSTGRQSYSSPFICELYSQGRNQIRLGMIESMSITRGAGNLGWTRNGEPLGIDVSFNVVDLSSIMHMPINATFGLAGAALTGGLSLLGSAADAAAGATIGADTNMSQTAEDMAMMMSKSTWDDDNAFSDYMAVLGCLSLAEQIYPMNRLRLRKAQRAAHWEQWTSWAHHANWIGGSSVGRLASALAHMGARE